MAFNPFLSMGEPAAAPATNEVLNPFMMSAEPEVNIFTGDNPFATSALPSSNSNPFSDFGGTYEPPAGDTVPIDIFGCGEPQGMGAKHFDDFSNETPTTMDIFASQPAEPERLVKPTELDLISTTTDNLYDNPNDAHFVSHTTTHPLPPETQNLILNVTGQMEFTSCDLLDRIPPTRTPSPVSLRDIHSPSPTPEPLELHEEPAPPPENLDINRNKPTRPPPARPPPAARPPPPRPAPPPIPPAPVQHPTEDINLFAAPQPVVVKPTKEAILSLYSAPKKEEEKPIDFLSDDIIDNMTAEPNDEQKKTLSKAEEPVMDTFQPNFTADKPSETIISNVTATATPMDCSEPPAEITPVISNSSPFSNIEDETYQEMPNDSEKNPFESANIADTSQPFAGNATNVFGISDDQLSAPVSEVMTTSYNAFATSQDVQYTESQNVFSVAPSNIFGDNQKNDFENEKPDTFGENQTGVFVDNNSDAFNGTDAFGRNQADTFGQSQADAFGSSRTAPAVDLGWGASPEAMVHDGFPESQDAFDAFSAKFDSTSNNRMNTAAWGDDKTSEEGPAGFEAEAFDPFLNMSAPPPPTTPRLPHEGSQDSNDDNFSLFIRPKDNASEDVSVPALAPPPRPAALPDSPRANPFDKTGFDQIVEPNPVEEERRHSGSGGETPPTPLFDEDVSMPLEDFPRTQYNGQGWEMQLRQPNKKKITGQRFWKKIFVRLVYQGDNPAVQLFNAAGDKEPFQELPLQACYSVSDIGAQQFDQFGKIFTVKLQYVFYKERPGVRPGQVTKAERITNKISQFAAYAIQGDYQGVKEFGSDLRKLGLPVEHAPQVSQLFKLGSLDYEHVKEFSSCIEEALFRIPAHRDRALSYKMEEVQITAVDELYVEQDAEGGITKQIARVRLFFLGFLSGMPDIELGVNDLRRQGKEVVGRHDIIPVATEEWIRVENAEFHACVSPQDFHETQIIKFKPPDACYIELLRFRVRPPKNRELPLQLKAQWCVTGNKVELRADVLVPGFASRKLGQVPCEDVAIRFPIPESWIYLFRVEKHFRYGSVKSAHRRTGKIKGIERFLGAVDTLSESLIEVTSGQAKYEHQHRAIVWRMPRLPKEGQGAYTTHNLVSRMALTSYDQIPAELAKFAYVEFTMPATQVSHVTARSVSLQNHDNDPPEKYVRYLARHEYIVGIERTSGQSAPAYAVAASTDRAPPAPAPAPVVPQPPSSDSDSD